MFRQAHTMLILIYLLYFFNIYKFSNAESIVFDTQFPIIYEDPSVAERPTYFGYSIIMYSMKNWTWIQVGAPRANDSRNGKTFKERGLVYRCPIKEKCQPVYVDHPDDMIVRKELKDYSLLGASMAINEESGDIVVCSPKWKNLMRKNSYFVEGACYTSNVVNDFWHVMTPLTDKNRELYVPKDKHTNFPWYIYGQAGFSAHFPKNSYLYRKLILGAPGLLNWRGSVAFMKHVPPFDHFSKRDLGSGSYGEERIPSALQVSELRDGDYAGYSISSGFYYSQAELLYAVGVPKANFKGQVIIITYPNRSDEKINVRQTIVGPEFGGYFGYAIESADLNGDELTDLIVSAPYLKIPKVFVYFGNYGKSLVAPSKGKYLLGGPLIGSFSRFGLALSTGDLNLDGYEDVIVGAPEGDENGAIAIYFGSIEGIQDSLPSQVIIAREVSPNLKGLGFSLSAPTDIDGNSYPDIAVGSYLSGHAVVFRNRNRAKISLDLKGPLEIQQNDTQFTVTVCTYCSTIKSFVKPTQQFVSIEYSISFMGDNRIKLKKSKNGLTINTPWNEYKCENVTVLIEKSRNYLKPVDIKGSISIKESKLTSNQIFISKNGITGSDRFNDLNPVMDETYGSKDETIGMLRVPFHTGCNNKICKPNLRIDITYPNLKNNQFVLGSSKSIMMTISVKNIGESAYSPKIKLLVPFLTDVDKRPTKCSILKENLNKFLVCDLNNPLNKNSVENVTVEINMREVTKGAVMFKAETDSFGEEINPEDNKIQSVVTIILDARVVVAGKSIEETYYYEKSADKPTRNLAVFKHLYEIQKFGVSPINTVLLIVKIPYASIVKGNLINFVEVYMPEGYIADQPFYCENVGFEYNVRENEETRAKRSLKEDQTPSRSQLPENRTVFAYCEDDLNNCHEIKCLVGPFTELQTVGRILLTMAIDIKTFTDKIANTKDILVLKTEAVANVVQESQEKIEYSHYQVFSVFISSPPVIEAELWIIIISIILGLLLLLVLTTGLAKAGFFERKIKKELETLKETEKTAAQNEDVEWSEDIKEEEANVEMDLEKYTR